MKLYKAYNFRTKDPVIDELRTIFQKENAGKLNGRFLAKIEADGGPTAGAMRGWFYGATRRPQSASVEAAGRAIGYRRTWTRMPKA